MNKQKLLAKAISGPKNLHFTEAVVFAKEFGYRLSRTTGSQHIFTRPRLKELVNLQEVGGKAKPYQVRQLLDIVERYNLTLETGE